MAKRADHNSTLNPTRYAAHLGEVFVAINSTDHRSRCRALAMTDWEAIDVRDAVGLLAPLAADASIEVRQLVALQLATVAGSGGDPRAVQALVTLSMDEDPAVRGAAGRSAFVAHESSLTQDGGSAISHADRFVRVQHDGEAVVLLLRCPNESVARRLRAAVTGLSVREMAHPSEQKSAKPTPDRNCTAPDKPTRLPDVLIDEEQSSAIDLPRRGTVSSVPNVSQGSIRLPDVLIDE